MVVAACSPPPAPPVQPAAPPREALAALAEPLPPPEMVPVDAPFTSLPDEHAWAPGGTVVAIADAMQRVLLWDAAAGAPRGIFGPFPERPRAIVWAGDGERLAVKEGSRVRVFALRDGAPVGSFDVGGTDFELLISPDGKSVHLLGPNGMLVTRDAATGAETAHTSLSLPAPGTVGGGVLSPDGTRIAAVLQGRPARAAVWSLADGKRLALDTGAGAVTWAEDGESVYLHAVDAKTASLRLRPGAATENLPAPVPLPGLPRFVVHGYEAGRGTTLSTADGVRLPGPFPDEEAELLLGMALGQVRFNADATELVTHRARGVDRWDLRSGRLLGSLPLDPAFIGKNARLLVAAEPGDGARVQIVDAVTGQAHLVVVSGSHEPSLYGRVDQSENGKRLAILGVPDGARPAKWPGVTGAVRAPEAELVTLVDFETGTVERVLGGAGAKIVRLGMCAEGKILITHHEKGKDGKQPLRVWTTADGARRVEAPEGEVRACSDDGGVVAILVKAEKARPTATKGGAKAPASAGGAAASAPASKPAPPRGRLDFYDTRTRRRLSSVDLTTDWPSFSLSPDGALAALAGQDAPEVVVWDVRSGKRRATLPGQRRAGFAAWSHSGKRLAVAPEGATVLTWDAETSAVEPLAGTLPCHDLRWSSDDKRLLVMRSGAPDALGRATAEIYGEHGERLDKPGRTFGIPAYRPALLIVDAPDGTRTHYDGFGVSLLGTETKTSILASWRAPEVTLDPFVWMELSPDGRFGAVNPFGVPAIIRLSDGAAVVLRPFTVGARRLGVATSPDGRFSGDPDAFPRLTFRQGHWLRGQLLTGRDVARERNAPDLLRQLFAGAPR